MRLTIVFFMLLTITSCDEKKKSTADKLNDSYNKYLDSIYVKDQAHNMAQDIIRDAFFDTVGIGSAPVKVLRARLVKREYSNYKDIALTYKNVSGKNISAIRFRWYGLNAFGEPADMGTSLQEGFGSGFDDEGLRVGRSTTSQWSILSGNAKKIVLAWPYEIVFEDGSKWQSSNN